MLERLKSILKSDDFIPTSAVFPDIDTEKIAKKLKLEEQGKSRGINNQPPSGTLDFDHVETGIIAHIEELRRKGLEHYENNRSIYKTRLLRADQAAQDVAIAVGSAKNDFGSLVQKWRSRIEGVRERLYEVYRWRGEFRQIHGLGSRPAKEFEGWWRVVMLAIILIVCEAGINTYLFSKGNEFGLLGGMIAAALVSAVNVSASGLFGYLARYIHHHHKFLQFAGACAIVVWVLFMATFNLGLAHFRDGLEHGVEWSQASTDAIPHLLAAPLSLASVESWLLCGLGILVSILSFRKGLHTDDPYPGYGRVERDLVKARRAYEMELADALDELAERRDQAVEELEDANRQMRFGMNEAINALYGQNALGAHLTAFLEQCDVKVAFLLAIYRDANRAARTADAPDSFSKAYIFNAFEPEAANDAYRISAEKAAENVKEAITMTISEIFAQFDTARKTFEVTGSVQRPEKEEARQD